MKNLSVLFFAITLSSQAFAQITCQTKADASCSTEDGICFEYFETETSDLEVFEGLCEQIEGAFTEAVCDPSLVELKCLTAANPVMPVMNFLKEGFSREDATMACTMMSGEVCP
jgi:hypothetical protein